MNFKTLSTIVFLILMNKLSAYELKFRLLDNNTHETVVGASVINLTNGSGTISNIDGEAIFKLEKGNYNFVISFLGYQNDTLKIDLPSDTLIDHYLSEIYNKLSVIEVVGQKQQRDDGVISLSKTILDKMPTFFGERELVKAIQLLPGVQSGSEGSTNIFVRGGMADQNLITIDEVPIYNLNHLFGILSVFNSDVISAADLYKNYLPSRYSGRITSALAVKTKTPSLTDTHIGFQIGLVNSRISVETPLIKNKLSTQIGIRGFYAGLFIKPISKSQFKTETGAGTISYFFYDINSSLHYKINSKHSLTWTFFHTDDRYIATQQGKKEKEYNWEGDIVNFQRNFESTLKWRDLLSSVTHRWDIKNHLFFQQKIFVSQFQLSKKYLTHRDYFHNDELSGDIEDKMRNSLVDLTDWGYVSSIDWSKKTHRITSGVRFFNRSFVPNRLTIYNSKNKIVERDEKFNSKRIFTPDLNIYTDYNIKLDKWNFSFGVNLNYYKNKLYQNFAFLPGVSVELKLPKFTVLQLSGNVTTQNLHMLYGAMTDVMNDVWVPATKKIPAQKAYQTSLSYRQELENWSWSVETFYRYSINQVEYMERDLSDDKTNWENQILGGGHGRAYGLELYLTKQLEKWNFTASYNLSKSEKKFKELNRGKWYPFTYDRRHDISLLLSYSPNKKLDFTVSWVFGTGRPYTMPDILYPGLEVLDYYDNEELSIGFFGQSDKQVKYFEKRNDKRLRSFHHLDIGMNYKWTKGKRKQTFNFSIYNVYNQKNVFSLYYNSRVVEEKRIDYDALTLLPFMPSFSYSVEF